jgi:hypothetical protein
MNVNMGNDRMITNKVKPMFSSGTNLPQHTTCPHEICESKGANGAGFPPNSSVFPPV